MTFVDVTPLKNRILIMIMTPSTENVDGVFDDIFNFGNEKSTASDGQFFVCQKAKLVNIYSQLV